VGCGCGLVVTGNQHHQQQNNHGNHGQRAVIEDLARELGFAPLPVLELVPILHADLYRVTSHQGIGIEDYLDSHLRLIEWPDRALGLIPSDQAWHVSIEFAGEGRRVTIAPPTGLQ